MNNFAENNAREAYQGTIVLTEHHSADADSWKTGMNNNILVLGCSGSGKTRNHLKPNLMQCNGSYIVLDTKGSLYDEMGAFLALQGYQVDQLNFTTMGGTCGYDPLHQVRFQDGRPNQQDIIAIASAICPQEAQKSDPFWGACRSQISFKLYCLRIRSTPRRRVEHGFRYKALRKGRPRNPEPIR